MKLRKSLSLVLAAFLLVALAAGCSSEYPGKNINVIIQYSAGGPTDMSVRGMLDVASNELPGSVSFIPNNRTGAGGVIGMTETANSKKDGYNIGVISVDLLMHHYLGRTDLNLDNFTPLGCTMADPYGLVVNSSAEYKTVDEFIQYARANPGAVTVGNSSPGGAPHLAAVAFENAFGISFTHVPYDGSADCVAAIAGGHLDATFTQLSPAKAQMDAGVLTMLGILDEQRMASFPDIPTVGETNPIDFNMRGWVVLAGPAGMEQEHVDYLTDLFARTVAKQEYKDIIVSLGMEPVEITGDAITQMLQEDDAFYRELCAGLDIE